MANNETAVKNANNEVTTEQVEALKEKIRQVISVILGDDRLKDVEIVTVGLPKQVLVTIASKSKEVTGILIGRNGRTADALRTIAISAARNLGIRGRIRLDIPS